MKTISEGKLSGLNTLSSHTFVMRRNLFHQQLSRRPTTTCATTISMENLGLDIESQPDTSSEIVVRDESGNSEIDVATNVLMCSFEDQGTGSQEARDEEGNNLLRCLRLFILIFK